jgi:hypothetical protein
MIYVSWLHCFPDTSKSPDHDGTLQIGNTHFRVIIEVVISIRYDCPIKIATKAVQLYSNKNVILAIFFLYI